MFDRRHLKEIDWVLIALVGIFMVVGLVVLASATRAQWGDWESMFFVRRQATWALVGLAVGALLVAFDYRQLRRYGPVLYGVTLALLGLVLLVGEEIQGARRWLILGPVVVQPSELAKIFLIISLAAWMAPEEEDEELELPTWQSLLEPVAYILPPMALVALQPDIGTAAVLGALMMGMLVVAGAPLRRLVLLASTAVTGMLAVVVAQIYFGIELLREYQLNRLLVFLDPSQDILGSGYHILQSRLAIGSGRLMGQGLFQGQQTQLRFLPEQHTDFIFTVVGEELGFIGAVVILSLYFLLLHRGLLVIRDAQDHFGALLAAGIVAMLAFHIVVNVGMTVGVMPVTGLPLPFLSYGGSNLMASTLGVALLINVGMRRRKILF